MRRTVRDLAAHVGGRVVGDPDVLIRGFAGIDRAGQGDMTFVADDRYLADVARTKASAVVLKAEVPGCSATQIITPEPNLAFARIVSEAERARARGQGGIDKRAIVDPSAMVDETATIRAGAIVEARAKIGPRTVVGCGSYVGEDATIGADCLIHPNVSILNDVRIGDRVVIHAGAVLGSDGFGFAPDAKGVFHKIPQVGIVVVEDDVEIGANTCIDRARFHETTICRGAKIDNLVQIGHNVIVGAHSALAAHVGIAGSTVLGKHVALGGMVGVRDHLKLGDATRVGAFSGVGNDLDGGQDYLGIPAMPYRQGLKIRLLTTRLPEIDLSLKDALDRLKALEAEVTRLSGGDAP
jgi:UDP-3-O-[3-hydroxymyristoyl] glucosamine N-acyltransferase